jgi:hypothetical protein
VTEQQPGRLVFAGVLPEEQKRREMAEGVGVEIDSRLLPERALDLVCERARRLGASFARREQETVRIPRQQRPATRKIDIHDRAERVGDFKGERCPVLHLLRLNHDMAHASGTGLDDMLA